MAVHTPPLAAGLALPLAPSHLHDPTLPSWLEASTPRARDIYRKFGYELVGEIRIAKGQVDEQGRTKKGGDGTPMWGMICRA
jgi:hypothetical protein